MAEKKGNFFVNAFKDMKESAKEQHKVDKANFEAVKAESKANFEENRGSNTFKRAKENAKKSWEEAKMSPKERQELMQKEREEQIAQANARKLEAEERYNNAKVSRCKKDKK